MKTSVKSALALTATLALVATACGGDDGVNEAAGESAGTDSTDTDTDTETDPADDDGEEAPAGDEMPDWDFSGRELNVVTWGGVWTDSTREAFGDPFEELTGVTINYIVSGTDPTATVVLQQQQGNVQIDLTDTSTAARLELDGYLEPIPDDVLAILEAESREGTVFPYNLEIGSTATLIVCNPEIIERCPTNAAEFWDVENFPGPRAYAASYSSAMTFALLADGVPRDEIWPMDVERSINKLREIKPHITVWPDSGSMQEQVMIDEEVGIAFMWNGRAHVVKRDHMPHLEFHWEDATVSSEGGYAVPKGAPNADVAFAFMEFVARNHDAQAQWTNALTYPTPSKYLLDNIPPEIADALPAAHDPVVIPGKPLAEQTPEMQAAWQAFLSE